jgi:hypothetical protein
MRKGLLTGVIGVMGLAAPTGLIAAMSSTAASVAPAISSSVSTSIAPAVNSLGGTLMPGIVHEPLLGKHLLSVQLLSGLRESTQVQSSNWGGYATTNDTFQTASSSWIQPTVNCAPTHGGFLGIGATHTAYSSFWVGLDGYTSSSVEQTGTDSDCGSAGNPIYYAWYEMYPASSVQLPNPVSPGDSMTAMVMSSDASHFQLQLKDNTKGWTSNVPETGGSYARSSAEFVAEAPSQCFLLFCSELPLADFSPVSFSSATVGDTAGHVGGIGAFSNAQMTMVSNGQLLATPGPLSTDGKSFTVNWNS